MEQINQSGSRNNKQNRKRSRNNGDEQNSARAPGAPKKMKRDSRMEIGSLLIEKDEEVQINPPTEVRFPCPYGINICPSFAESEIRRLRAHITKYHRGLGDNVCWRCIKVCKSAEILINHIRGRHSEEDNVGLRKHKGKVLRNLAGHQ